MDNFERNQNEYDDRCVDLKSKDAIGMAELAGIDLTDQQIKDYVYYRTSREDEVLSMSDQQLLHLILNSEQKDKFEKTFWNVRFL
jgi:hypothetical protein